MPLLNDKRQGKNKTQEPINLYRDFEDVLSHSCETTSLTERIIKGFQNNQVSTLTQGGSEGPPKTFTQDDHDYIP